MLRLMMAGALVLAAYGVGHEGGAFPDVASPMDADEQAIRQAVQYYFDGGRNADSATVAKAFERSVAHMIFIRDNKLMNMPIPEFFALIARNRTPEFKPDSYERRVVLVDHTGNAAVAKLEIVTPQNIVTDYMSLLRIDGQWKIVNKIFDRAPKSSP